MLIHRCTTLHCFTSRQCIMYGRYHIYLAYGMTHADKKPKQTSLNQLLAGFFSRSGKSYIILESNMKKDT